MTRLATAFMGTPEIAVPALRTLAELTAVAVVITQPDRPSGRGQQEQPSPIKRAAMELGLPVWQPQDLRGAGQATQLQGLDLIVVMAFGRLLRQEVLDAPGSGCINLHASLLPRWRGASPLQAALRAGDHQTGVSVMRMVAGLDAGPVYLAETLEITPRTTLPALHDAVALAAARALARFLAAWPGITPTAQDEAAVTICRKLDPQDGHLDFASSAAELERWVRAYTPAPGCWVLSGSQRLRILEVEPRPGISILLPGVVAAQGGELLVGCRDGACAILRVQPPGGRVMPAADYLRGHPVPERLA